jgi:uncharacterized coiled-coil DUF342 family protein
MQQRQPVAASKSRRPEVRAISNQMAELVEEMGELNDRAARTRDRAERERLRVELVEKGEQVLQLYKQYRNLRTPKPAGRSKPAKVPWTRRRVAEFRTADELADTDLS